MTERHENAIILALGKEIQHREIMLHQDAPYCSTKFCSLKMQTPELRHSSEVFSSKG